MRKVSIPSSVVALLTLAAVLLMTACPNPASGSDDGKAAPPTAAATVTNFAVPGVAAPVAGAAPVLAFDDAQYSGAVAWSPAVPSVFAAHTAYTATIEVTPKEGWTLFGIPADSFTVAGAVTTHVAGSGSVKAAFPATFAAPILSWVRVPAGRYQRDATSTNISVITKPYYIGRHEITRAQFLSVMGVDPSNSTYSSGTSDPAQMVNWYHAIAFCNKLSLREGYAPVYAVADISDWMNLPYASIPTSVTASWNNVTADWDADGYRLPTEMEWMWAAMGAPADGQGGGTNTTGYMKAFAGSTGSNAIGDYAVFGYYGTETGKTATERSNPVGSKLPNEPGLYDMSGNVWEWVWDWHAAYPTGTLTDYRGAAPGADRNVRGNGWSNTATLCAVASRYFYNPISQYRSVGFRLVRPCYQSGI